MTIKLLTYLIFHMIRRVTKMQMKFITMMVISMMMMMTMMMMMMMTMMLNLERRGGYYAPTFQIRQEWPRQAAVANAQYAKKERPLIFTSQSHIFYSVHIFQLSSTFYLSSPLVWQNAHYAEKERPLKVIALSQGAPKLSTLSNLFSLSLPCWQMYNRLKRKAIFFICQQ